MCVCVCPPIICPCLLLNNKQTSAVAVMQIPASGRGSRRHLAPPPSRAHILPACDVSGQRHGDSRAEFAQRPQLQAPNRNAPSQSKKQGFIEVSISSAAQFNSLAAARKLLVAPKSFLWLYSQGVGRKKNSNEKNLKKKKKSRVKTDKQQNFSRVF